MILTALDQPLYFPNVAQSGSALAGLLVLSQAICESSYGAGRSLELQMVDQVLPVRPDRSVFLSFAPVSSIVSVFVRQSVNRWGRQQVTDWFPLVAEAYAFDAPINRLNLFVDGVTEIKVSYSSGFDFAGVPLSQDAQQIKAIAGVVVDWAARRYYGQLDSYLNNPSVAGAAAESWNFVRPDQYLQAMLLPLKKYAPRGSAA